MINVYFKENAIVAKIAAMVLRKNNCAIVFRRTIYLYNITKSDIRQNKELLCHEVTHVLQWKKYGIVRFLALYVWYSMKYGYYKNPFEIEARSREKDLAVLENIILK